ncbi:putative MAPEG superfamily protein [Pseudomonas laurylsulfativorans]|uniref:MAPEG family protein n=1 Tax=Pseudomonas laurylsulfativorans TaxID=1943631 RepID=UPI00209CF3B4|nr:MAPEG family protein [Pseudomonas laurylsulfativorans]MCP1420297.1 putative MAPEG superfamily protein [Pseudomonas laurylsulfativorans]
MSIPFWCVFISAVLIYLARMPVTTAMKELGGYDNHLPRQQQTQLTGLGARALAAHQNTFEAFILFAVGVLMAHTTQTAGWLIDLLAIIFVISRVIYLVCYWKDLTWQRSMVWLVGFICSLLLMISPTFRTILL